MKKLLKDIAIAAPIIAFAGWLGSKMKKVSAEAPQVSTPKENKTAGTEVYPPWIQSGQPSMSFPSSGGNNVPVSPNPEPEPTPTTINVKEESYSKIVTIDGTTTDDYTSENTYEFNETWNRMDIITEGGDVLIQIKRVNNTWTGDILVPEGSESIDFALRGIRIKNKVTGSAVNYYINLYRW